MVWPAYIVSVPWTLVTVYLWTDYDITQCTCIIVIHIAYMQIVKRTPPTRLMVFQCDWTRSIDLPSRRRFHTSSAISTIPSSSSTLSAHGKHYYGKKACVLMKRQGSHARNASSMFFDSQLQRKMGSRLVALVSARGAGTGYTRLPRRAQMSRS